MPPRPPRARVASRARRGATCRRTTEPSTFSASKLFLELFCKSQFPHKFVNLSFTISYIRISRWMCVEIDFCRTTLETLCVRQTRAQVRRATLVGLGPNEVRSYQDANLQMVNSWRLIPTKWLQERADGSKNGHEIPPRRAFCGSARAPSAPQLCKLSFTKLIMGHFT